jgi:hypothetical protein
MPDATASRSGLLRRHFLTRLIDNDLVSPDADAHKGASVGLAMLLSGGTVLTVLLGGKYITTVLPMPAVNAANYVDDALLYVVMSMLLLAIVAVVAWDGLALDGRDEAILGPLPIPRAMIVRAKLSAMAVLAAAVLIALNGPPTLLHPSSAVAMLPAGFAQMFQLMLAHAAATGGAGAFGFCAVLALREVARALLGAWWPAVSARLQAALILVLATAFLLTPAWLGNVPERLAAASGWRLAVDPPLWFVGLHQVMAGTIIVDLKGPPLPRRLAIDEDRAAGRYRLAQSGATPAAALAPIGVAGAFTIALGAFLWNARRPAARARTPRRGGGARATPFARLASATIARRPAVQAGFFFTLRVLARSVPHRAALAVAAALGLAVATIGVGRALRLSPAAGIPQALLGTQTLLVACILAGVEQAMRLPAHLPASWCARLAWPGDPRGYIAGVKRAVVVGLGVPVLGLLLIAHLALRLPADQAIAHYAIGLLLLAVGLEARFLAEHPLPFLTSYVTGNRIKLAPLWFVAAIVAAAGAAAVEAAALRSVSGSVALVAVLAGTWQALAWRGRRNGAPREDDLDLFQAQLDEATTLKL